MTIDVHRIDCAVILVSWADFGPEEYATGGGDYPGNSRGSAEYEGENLGWRGSRMASFYDDEGL